MTAWIGRWLDRAIGSEDVAPLAVKVPQIGVLFWTIKIVSTAMGESLADWLDGSPDLLVAAAGTLLALAAFVWALRCQFATRRFTAPVYWFAVAMVATFGTMVADALHQFTGLPYWSTTLFYGVILVVVFVSWWRSEHTLSIHSIDSRRREKFYWATVLSTFALGTATGDWTATDLHLGYFASAMLFLGVILLPALAYRFGASSIAMFWTAYVLTRPLGASFADFLDVPKAGGGVGIAHPIVWGTLAVVMATIVVVQMRLGRRSPASPDERPAQAPVTAGR